MSFSTDDRFVLNIDSFHYPLESNIQGNIAKSGKNKGEIQNFE